jgi:hypothetical protein
VAQVGDVFGENCLYYVLGFVSCAARRDGRFRPVKVQVDRPGLDVRARSGYYAPSDRAAKAKAQQSDPLDMALSRGLPAGDLPLRMTVAPFATADKPGGAIVLVVAVDRENVSGEMMVELAAAAFDDRWRQAAGQTQRLMLPHAEGQRVSDATVLLDVKPGRYEVRAAVKAPDGRTGSAFTSITVPEFARAPLSMSGLAIADGSPSVFPTGAAALGLPRLTTDRAFSSDRRVSLVSRIYQGGGKSGVSVTVRARIVNDRGAEQFTAESALAATTFADGRQADYRFALPLDRLSVGDYLVTIEATAGLLTERRQLRFAVSR